ncbi:tetratricopeptide repeat protein [Nocardia sp. NPDC056100]|uniref:tetratricopeptide repeat protein n=1 Tax=Nocardia sp. NPDC056100 TaxID=3345712 RepID=UPI0035DB4A1E
MAMDEADSEAKVERLRRTIATNPEHPDLVELVDQLIARGDLAEAQSLLEHVLGINPAAPGLTAKLADALRTDGEIDRAEELLRVALSAYDDHPALLVSLADVLITRQDFSEAEQTLNQARAVAPTNAEVMVRLADVFRARGEIERAAVILRLALDDHPDDPGLLIGLADVLIARQDFSEAEHLLGRAHEVTPNSPEVMVRLADVCMARGDFDQAIAILREVFTKAPPGRHESLYAKLADALDARGSTQDREESRALRTQFGALVSDDSKQADRSRRVLVSWVAPEMDAPDQPDQLNRDDDARALATLLASNALQPPVALAVYGEWGSGKTFFMHRIQWWINEFSSGSYPTEMFGPGVEPVWFNAWHYAEGNLWASLLSQIFASLVPKDSRLASEHKDLLENVKATQQVLALSTERVEAAKLNVAAAEKRVTVVTAEHNEALEKAAKLRCKDLTATLPSEVTESLSGEIAELRDAAAIAGLPELQKDAQSLASASRDIIAGVSRMRILTAAGKNVCHSPLMAGLGIAVLVAVATLTLGGVLRTQHMWVGTATAVVGQFTAITAGAVTVLQTQAHVIRKILKPAEKIQRTIQDRVAAERVKQLAELVLLEENVVATRAALVLAHEQEAAAKSEAHSAEQDEKNLTVHRLLRRYLTARANSTDYEQFKGVVALAHRDLKELSSYLVVAAKSARADTDQPLRRIVLYIDDLDRCDPKTVVDVLAAVHLLLALPLFVVVVGVDPRWLNKSLRQATSELSPGGPGAATPADYLEKIFQLTYTLPPMNETGCKTLLMATAKNTRPLQNPSAPSSGVIRDITSEEVSLSPVELTQYEVSDTDVDADAGADLVVDAGLTAEANIRRAAEALELADDDIQAIGKVSWLVSTSPRRAKRFLNTYLVVRGRVFTDPEYTPPQANRSDHGLLLLLALRFGTPTAAKELPALGVDLDLEGTLCEWITSVQKTAPAEEAKRLNAFQSKESELCHVPISEVVRWSAVSHPFLAAAFDPAQ